MVAYVVWAINFKSDFRFGLVWLTFIQERVKLEYESMLIIIAVAMNLGCLPMADALRRPAGSDPLLLRRLLFVVLQH